MSRPPKRSATHSRTQFRGNVSEEGASTDANFATTLAKGLAVIEAFEPHTTLLGNSELAARTGLARPTVARLTSTLARLGYLKYDEARAKYRLGVRVLRISRPLLAAMKIRQIALPMMLELSESVRGTVSLGMIDDTSSVYVETARSGDVGPHIPDVGAAIPLVRSSMGRALASMLPVEERSRLEASMRRDTPDLWRTYEKNYKAGIEQCSQRGFCIAQGDWVSTIHAVGAPLYRMPETGEYFAINCGVPVFRLRAEQLGNEIGPRLKALAASIRSIVAGPSPEDNAGVRLRRGAGRNLRQRD